MRRRIVQLIALLATNSYFPSIKAASFYQGNLKGVCVPVLNCYSCPGAWGSCPIGALQHFIIVRQFPFYVLGILGMLGVFVGRWPCGWVRPRAACTWPGSGARARRPWRWRWPTPCWSGRRDWTASSG